MHAASCELRAASCELRVNNDQVQVTSQQVQPSDGGAVGDAELATLFSLLGTFVEGSASALMEHTCGQS